MEDDFFGSWEPPASRPSKRQRAPIKAENATIDLTGDDRAEASSRQANVTDGRSQSRHDGDVMLGYVQTDCVGIQHYRHLRNGVRHVGEIFQLHRDPLNVHDRNAIAVHALGPGTTGMVGHVPRETAALLARVADDRRIAIKLVGQVGKHAPVSAVGDSDWTAPAGTRRMVMATGAIVSHCESLCSEQSRIAAGTGRSIACAHVMHAIIAARCRPRACLHPASDHLAALLFRVGGCRFCSGWVSVCQGFLAAVSDDSSPFGEA